MSVVHRVSLPRGALPRVVEGQSVDPPDELASRRPPGDARALPLAARLRLPPHRVGEALLVSPGAELAADEPLARVGTRRPREVRVPTPSLFLGWDRSDGSALVAPLNAPQPIRGHVRGVVSTVGEELIEITVDGALVEGVAGGGGEAHGELRMAVRDPSDELRASAIDVGSAGRILVGGSRASAEALIRARAMGVAGVVLGGVLDKELRDFEAIQERRREMAGAESLAILILSGYGKVPFDAGLLAWFRGQEGRLASLFGAGGRLYVYDAAPPPPRRHLPRSGERVIARRRPHAGQAGTLVRVLEGLHAAPSGIAVESAIVRFDDGRVAAVPLANLEAIGPAPGG